MAKTQTNVERVPNQATEGGSEEFPVSASLNQALRPANGICNQVHSWRPRVVFARALLPHLHYYISEFLAGADQVIEAGGMWLGEFDSRRRCPEFKINGFIEAGPAAECSPVSILFDTEYQAAMLKEARMRNPHLGNMGCFHLHPGRMDECSVGDLIGDVQAVRDSDTRALVFGIITLNNPKRDPKSLFYRNFKLDLFVLGEQTNFQYVHVRPVLTDLIVQRVPNGADAPGPRANLNLEVRHGRHCSGLLGDKRRLVAEVRAMEERYGDRATLRYAHDRLFWEYTVVESGRHFPVEIRYPRHYPLEPPRIISRLPLPSSPHQLVDNELCWMDRSAHSDWNPARDTAAVCIHAAQRWFACLLVYLTLGEWPEEANDPPPVLP